MSVDAGRLVCHLPEYTSVSDGTMCGRSPYDWLGPIQRTLASGLGESPEAREPVKIPSARRGECFC